MEDNNPKQPNRPPSAYTPQELAAFEDARQKMQDMRDFSQNMVRTFKELNGIVNRTSNTFGTSADFAKEILTNTKARASIEEAISRNISESEKEILELQYAKYDAVRNQNIQEQLLSNLQEQIANRRSGISQLQEEENDLVKQHVEMTDKMVGIQDEILGIEKDLEATVVKKLNAEEAIAKAKQGILSVDSAILANQNAIVENAQKKQSIDAKLFALEERMNEAQLRSIHDGIDLSAEYNSMMKQREFLQKRQADLESTNNKYIADGLKLQERRGRIEHTLLNAQDDFNESLSESISLEENLTNKNVEQVELASEMNNVWGSVLDKQSQRNELEKELESLMEEQARLKDEGVSPAFLDELIDRQKKLIAENQRASREYKLQVGYLAHMEDSQYAALGPAAGLVTTYKKFSENVKTIPIQFMLFDKLLSLAIGRFIELDKAAENFRKNTGFTNTQMAGLRKDVETVNKNLARFGVNIEAAYKAAQALTDVFGRTSLVTKDAIENIALMSANLGVVEADAAEALAIFQGMGGATQEVAMNTMMAGAALSEKTGVPFSKVMGDIAKSSGTTAMLLGTTPSKLMKAAVAARALGTDLNTLAAQQEKLLNYSDSINSELEASALLGRSISFQRARQLAYEGKVEESAKATLDMVKQAGDFNEMNIYQRKALAAASGMELKDLTKMMAVEAQKNEIRTKGTDEQKQQLKLQEAELEKLRKTNDLTKDNVLEENKKAIAQAKIQGLMTQINGLLEEMKIAAADILEPIITPLVKILIPVMKVVIGLAKILLWPFKALSETIVFLAEKTGEWAKKSEWIKSIASWISKATESVSAFYNENKKWIDSIGAVVGGGLLLKWFFGSGGLSGLMGMISAPFKIAMDGAKNLMQRVSGKSPDMDTVKPKSAMDIAKPKIPDASKGLSDTVKSAEKTPSGSGVKEFLTNLASGLKKMGDGKVLFGALNLIPASIGLIAMTPGAIGMAAIGFTGKMFEVGAKGLASGLSALAKPQVLLGTLALLGIGGAFALFGLGAKLVADAFVSIAAVIPEAIVPLTQLALLSPLLYIAAGGIGALAIGLGVLAAATIPATVASIAIYVVAKSVEKLGTSFEQVSKSTISLAKSIPSVINPIKQFASINMKETAEGMAMLSSSLASFGVGSAVAGIGSFVGNFLGGDPIAKMEKLASISDRLKDAASAISQIATATSRFNAVDSFAKSIGVLADSLNKLTDSLGNIKTEELAKLSTIAGATSTTAEAAPSATSMNTEGIESKLDKLTELLVGGAVKVYIDGKLVSSAIANTAGR